MNRISLGILDTLDGGDLGSQLLATEMNTRGHECRIVNPARFGLQLLGNRLATNWDGYPAENFDALVYRGSFKSSTEALALCETEREGHRFINQMAVFTLCADKMWCSFELMRKGYLTPPLLVTNSIEQARNFVQMHGDVVLKPISAWNGDDVFRLQGHDINLDATLRLFLDRHRVLYLQAFVHTDAGIDLRAYVVGRRYVGAVARRPAASHFLTNLTKGGTLEAAEVSQDVRDLCNRLGSDFNLELAGIDIRCSPAGPVVIEINPDPEWKEPEKFFGVDVTRAFADYLEREIRQ